MMLLVVVLSSATVLLVKRWELPLIGSTLNGEGGEQVPSAPSRPSLGLFDALRDLRNRLLHFTSSHETVAVGSLRFRGLADTSDLDGLDADAARDAFHVAVDVVAEVLRLRGLDEEDVLKGLHVWAGRIPVELLDGID